VAGGPAEQVSEEAFDGGGCECDGGDFEECGAGRPEGDVEHLDRDHAADGEDDGPADDVHQHQRQRAAKVYWVSWKYM